MTSAQLRRFFSEIKGLYNHYKTLTATLDSETAAQKYHDQIEPQFKMIRSKVSYACPKGAPTKIPHAFADMLDHGIQRVENHKDFVRFVAHLEAVVGFMYGHGKVKGR